MLCSEGERLFHCCQQGSSPPCYLRSQQHLCKISGTLVSSKMDGTSIGVISLQKSLMKGQFLREPVCWCCSGRFQSSIDGSRSIDSSSAAFCCAAAPPLTLTVSSQTGSPIDKAHIAAVILSPLSAFSCGLKCKNHTYIEGEGREPDKWLKRVRSGGKVVGRASVS